MENDFQSRLCPDGANNRAANTLFVSGTANELIGTDERWGELWITNWTSGAGSITSVNGNTFFTEPPTLARQENTFFHLIDPAPELDAD